MTLFLASWAGASVLVCRWVWAATHNGSSLDGALTMKRLRTVPGLKPPKG